MVFYGVNRELNRQFGCRNAGAAEFVRKKTACMMPWTQACHPACHDIGIVTAEDVDVAVRDVCAIGRHLTIHGWRPALIGCDHTASLIGLMGAVQGSRIPPVYLYFDAHYDLGRHAPDTGTHNGNFVDVLLNSDKVARVINVGGRSWSTFAPVYNEIPKFVSIPGGVPRLSAAEVIEKLYWLQGRPIYVSIDADVLDPACAPNVACPEPFGMSLEDLHTICAWLGSSCPVIGADLCEIVPSSRNLCSELALMRCLHALF